MRRRLRGLVLPLVCAAAWVALPSPAEAQQIVFVVRHAERADGGAAGGSMQAQTDPMLSEAGQARARRLAEMLADAGVSRVIATEYRRTQDTGRPLATRLGLEVEVQAARDTAALVERLRAEHGDEIVLVVGHSNTVPAIVGAYGGPAVTIGENEYDNLFVIVPATGAVTRIRF